MHLLVIRVSIKKRISWLVGWILCIHSELKQAGAVLWKSAFVYELERQRRSTLSYSFVENERVTH